MTPVTVDILKNLPDSKIMHATKTLEGPVHFHDINDKTTTCVGIVSEPMLNILNNVFISTATIFHHYELFTTSLFPKPDCPTMTFNIPSEFRFVYLVKFPRTIAILLKDFMLKSMLCVKLLHGDESNPLPTAFQDPI